MSLRQKLGILLLIMLIFFIGLAWTIELTAQQLEDVAARRRAAQVLQLVSRELPYGKLILQSELPEKDEILGQISNDVFLMQESLEANIELEEHQEMLLPLRELQLDLISIDLLLARLGARPSGQDLTPEDTLNLEQLEAFTNKVQNVVAEYTHHLDEQEIVIQNTDTLYTYFAVGILLAMAATIVGFFYYNVLRPINALSSAAEAISAENYGYQARVSGKDEFSKLADAFNAMTVRLRELVQTLEQRVVDRTQRLEIVADLGEQLSAILDFDQLLIELVNQVKESFDYYHAHIYIIDEERQNLIMTAGAGEPGRQMKAAGHRIPLNAPKSLVARAARSGETVWMGNVREEPDWLLNPLLPDTYSEMAVPIRVEGQTVGVLDVQQDAIAALDESDAGLLRSLAGHVAVAIRNAQLFANVEASLAESQRIQAQYLEQSWQQSEIAAMGGQYSYVAPTAPPLDEASQYHIAQIRRQALNSEHPAIIEFDRSDDENRKSAASPITLRGQTIGALHLHPGDNKREWTEQDLAMIQTIANRLAQTAENMRLFEETRERAGREAAIREITDKLRAAPNIDTLLETAARELGQRLDVPHTVLEMGIENSE